MKKHLVLGAMLAVTATPALATKARLLSLGENTNGSQYINDNRNIFLNAASANMHKNQVIFELGGAGATAGGGLTAKQDTITTPQAEGGVLMGVGNLVYGVYLGGESSYVQEARSYLNLGQASIHQDNQLDLFVAGDAGVKWGANLTYSSTNDDAGDKKSDTLSARLGAIANNIEGFANVSLMNKFEGQLGAPNSAKEEFDGKLGYELGATYNLGFAKVFAYWRHAGWEQTNDSTILQGAAYRDDAEITTDVYTLGYGREEKLNDKATLFIKAAYVMNKRELKTNTDGKADLNDYSIPLTIGLEYDAASWLTLRGSIVQSLMNESDNDYDDALLIAGTLSTGITDNFRNGKSTRQNTTSIRSGATLKFGDFSVDGLLMASETTGASNGTLNTENLLMRVAATYKF